MFKAAGRCPAMKRSYCSAIQEIQEICFHTLPLPSLHEKCSTTYPRTWVGGGRGPRRVEGGIGVLGIGGSAPAQKIRYMCTLCIHLFCLYPNAPRCRHDALPNGALTHHILQETPTLDAHSHTCANACLLPCGLQHGALSRLSYRRDF